MPKVKETKKLEHTKPVLKEDPKVIIFRLFECVVHLEESLTQLKKVGIFPGPQEQADELKRKMSHALTNTESLYKDYLALWGGMQKP